MSNIRSCRFESARGPEVDRPKAPVIDDELARHRAAANLGRPGDRSGFCPDIDKRDPDLISQRSPLQATGSSLEDADGEGRLGRTEPVHRQVAHKIGHSCKRMVGRAVRSGGPMMKLISILPRAFPLDSTFWAPATIAVGPPRSAHPGHRGTKPKPPTVQRDEPYQSGMSRLQEISGRILCGPDKKARAHSLKAWPGVLFLRENRRLA
jgi:hypothetical protein